MWMALPWVAAVGWPRPGLCPRRNTGKWDAIHEALRGFVRDKAGKEATPSAAIIDSQSVKTVQKGDSVATTLASKPRGESVI